jgi:cold shock CspA family protein
MQSGRIKSLEPERGFGFITPDSATGRERGRGRMVDVFFHRSVVADDAYDTLHVGQRVRYERKSDDPNQHRPPASVVQPVIAEPIREAAAPTPTSGVASAGTRARATKLLRRRTTRRPGG